MQEKGIGKINFAVYARMHPNAKILAQHLDRPDSGCEAV
jgi:hypothetical protein